jgi:hypothetical protein
MLKQNESESASKSALKSALKSQDLNFMTILTFLKQYLNCKDER